MADQQPHLTDLAPDELAIELDGKDVHPDSVDTGRTLEFVAAMLELIGNVAKLDGRELKFSGLAIRDKCAQMVVRTSDGERAIGFGGWQTVGDITFVMKDLSLNTIILATHPTLDADADPVAMMAAVGAAIFKGAATVPTVQLQWLNKPQWRYGAPLRTVVAGGGAAPAVYSQEGGFTWAQLEYDKGKPLLMAMTSTSTEFAKELKVDSYSTLPQPPHVGDPLDVGGARMVINAIVPTKQVGMKAMPRAASEGASWVVVRYAVENTGNDTTLGVPGNDMHLRDAAGRNFRASGEGTTELALAEGLDLIVTQLQPGIVKPLVQVFEVPDTVLGNLTLVVPHGNPLSGQQYELALDLD